jgi:hypothetical protein
MHSNPVIIICQHVDVNNFWVIMQFFGGSYVEYKIADS